MDPIDIMRIALDEARKGFDEDEIPVGAVIARNGSVIAAAHNTNRAEKNPLRHAELTVIEKAAAHFKNERLAGCELYVTKEPCAMCAGAIIHSRLSRVVIGARDTRYGACGTVFSVCGNVSMNHVPPIEFGVLERESSEILKEFFKLKRTV